MASTSLPSNISTRDDSFRWNSASLICGIETRSYYTRLVDSRSPSRIGIRWDLGTRAVVLHFLLQLLLSDDDDDDDDDDHSAPSPTPSPTPSPSLPAASRSRFQPPPPPHLDESQARELRRLANLEGHGDLFERVFWPKFQELVPTVWKMATAKGLVVVRSIDSDSSPSSPSRNNNNNDNRRLKLNGREVREWVGRGGVAGAMEWLRSARRAKEQGDGDDGKEKNMNKKKTMKKKKTAITTTAAAAAAKSNPPKTTTTATPTMMTTTACGPPSFPLPLPSPPPAVQQTKTKIKTRSSGPDYYGQEEKKQVASISYAPPSLPAAVIASLGLFSLQQSSSSSPTPTSTPTTLHDGDDGIVSSLATALGSSYLSFKAHQLPDAAETVSSSQSQHHHHHHQQTAANNITGPVKIKVKDKDKGKMSSEARTHTGEQGNKNGRSFGSNGEGRGLLQSRWA